MFSHFCGNIYPCYQSFVCTLNYFLGMKSKVCVRVWQIKTSSLICLYWQECWGQFTFWPLVYKDWLKSVPNLLLSIHISKKLPSYGWWKWYHTILHFLSTVKTEHFNYTYSSFLFFYDFPLNSKRWSLVVFFTCSFD